MATIRRSLFAGEVLYRQGDPADCAWLIESGRVVLASSDGQRRHEHGTFGPGEMLDELSMLDHGARTATATAASDAVLLAIEDEAFRERIESCDPVVRAMVEGLARRMRRIQSGGENENVASLKLFIQAAQRLHRAITVLGCYLFAVCQFHSNEKP